MNTRVIRLLAGVCCGLLLAGCGGTPGARERREEDYPLMKRALDAKRANDVDRAIAGFQEALDKKPGLARAHLELGLLYDEYKKDYIRAIYHYQRYLELRPDAEKRQYVEPMIQYARISFAASFPDHPSEAIRRVGELEAEVQSLETRLEQSLDEIRTLRADAATRPMGAAPTAPSPSSATPAPATTPASARPTPPPLFPGLPPPASGGTTVVVKPGDTLSSIASRVYGNPGRWQTIFDANRTLLKTPGDVRPGQTLTIPPDTERRPSR